MENIRSCCGVICVCCECYNNGCSGCPSTKEGHGGCHNPDNSRCSSEDCYINLRKTFYNDKYNLMKYKKFPDKDEPTTDDKN